MHLAASAALKRAIKVEPLARPASIAEIVDGSGAGASGRTSESRQNEPCDDLKQRRRHLEHNQSDDDCNDHPGHGWGVVVRVHLPDLPGRLSIDPPPSDSTNEDLMTPAVFTIRLSSGSRIVFSRSPELCISRTINSPRPL